MTNWHDTPTTKAGTYWVKTPLGDEEPIHLAPDGSWWYADHPKAMANVGGCKFGNRLPTNDELAELPGLVEEYGDAVRSAAICGEQSSASQGFYERDGDGILGKIKAILGVADDAGAD